MSVVFKGDETRAYRDPAAFFFDGTCYLFYTYSIRKNGFMYNHIAVSESKDTVHWSSPKVLTPTDLNLNFSSPGNVIKFGDYYYVFICSYPMPYSINEKSFANENARLFYIRTADFNSFSEPERIYPKGKDCPFGLEGRMIDPYVFSREDTYYLYFKSNGIAFSKSDNIFDWEYIGKFDGGENVCVIDYKGGYRMLHSPDDGIGLMDSEDAVNWTDKGMLNLDKKTLGISDGRLTAGFAVEYNNKGKNGWLIFFHQSKKDVYPETHGQASLACVFTNDFNEFELNYKD